MVKKLNHLISNWIVYPVLFALTEILILTGPNLANVKLSQAWAPMLWLAGASIVVLFAFYAWCKNWHRAGLLTLLFLIWFDRYGFAAQAIEGIPGVEMKLPHMIAFFFIWTAPFLLIGSSFLWRKVQKPSMFTQYLNVVMVLLLAYSAYRIFSYESQRIPQTFTQEFYPLAPALQSDQMPDIYYIIADGYGRQDVLKEIYNVDNQSFIEYLKESGFYVADQSRSNYIRTMLSMSSALNFGYLPDLSTTSNDEGPLQWLYTNSRLRRALEDLGYQTTWMTGWQPRSAENIVASLFWLNSITALPVEAGILPSSLPTFREQHNLIDTQIAKLAELAAQTGPKFVYLHILVPHPPFIYDHDGPVTPNEVYMLSDAGSFPGSPAEYVQGYSEQIQYVNVLLRQAVENILANSAQPPIIIIQGDHGGGAYLTGSVEESCIRERYSILNAYHLPGEAAQRLYPGITPINTFRLILSSYFGADLELIEEEKSYFSPAGQTYRFIDVTGLASQACEIP